MERDRTDWIAARAYGLWEERGRPEGQDAEHWRQAEAEYHALRSDQGFEVWFSKSEPEVRLAVAKGGALPVELGSRDWHLIGPLPPDAEIERHVREKGFFFFRSEDPPPDLGAARNSEAAGA